jgi:threonine/homoserine/homoserine lactone efflux protein
VLKLLGAAYLVFLGGQAILRGRKPEPESGGGGSFRRGFVSNLLNPKIGVFYSTFLPQFLVPGRSVLLQSLALATLHNLMGLAWLPSYASLVVKAGDFLRRSRVRRTLDRITGVVLVGLGIRLALERR